MPEAPQMQALAERIEAWLDGATFEGYEPLGFSGLKTYDPPPEALVGRDARSVSTGGRSTCRSWFGDDLRMLVPPLAGRTPRLRAAAEEDEAEGLGRAAGGSPTTARCWSASTAPSARRAGGCSARATTVRSRSSVPKRRATSSPSSCARATDGRRIHTILRDQRTVAGVGRGYADDVLHRAKLSPYASLKSLTRRRARAAARRAARRARRRSRARTHARGRAVAEQARRALHRARQARRAVSRVRRPTSSACRTSRTRSSTARRVRPAARCSPTAASRASSSEGSCDNPQFGVDVSHTVTSAPSGPTVSVFGPRADEPRRVARGERVVVERPAPLPVTTNPCTNGAAGAGARARRHRDGRPTASRPSGGS